MKKRKKKPRDRGSKRNDMLRLREIMSILIEPFKEMEHLSDEQKLMAAFDAPNYPVYRRPIIANMPVEGLWWMDKEQWIRFAWSGHNVVKSGQDPDRVFTTLSYNNKGFCYVRELPDRIDLEAMVRTTKWDVEKKKRKGYACEWMTVSISKDEYLKLEKYLGPKEDSCRHW